MRRSILGRGFTLIELLVVIAIIAILAAIMFPVFAQAKVSAKQAACILQVRQVGMALGRWSLLELMSASRRLVRSLARTEIARAALDQTGKSAASLPI